jgi:hypothetical protein
VIARPWALDHIIPWREGSALAMGCSFATVIPIRNAVQTNDNSILAFSFVFTIKSEANKMPKKAVIKARKSDEVCHQGALVSQSEINDVFYSKCLSVTYPSWHWTPSKRARCVATPCDLCARLRE